MIFAAVIVTFNRISILKEVLDSFDNQSRLPDYVIVVNNASTDGTDEFLSYWEKKNVGNQKIVFTSDINLGGSGGFYFGTKKAMETDADWVWVSDDDAVPELDVFEKAEIHINKLKNENEVSAVCSAVWTDGKIALSNRSRRKMTLLDIKLNHVSEKEYEKAYFECDNFSYVGVLLNRSKLSQIGLIKEEYFIWRDDVEHSWRLSKVGKIICYADMIVNHKVNVSDYDGVSWKTFYAYRNDLLMLKEHCPKRYYFFKAFKAHLKGIMSQNKKIKELYLDSIECANKNITGMSEKYRPGMKIF